MNVFFDAESGNMWQDGCYPGLFLCMIIVFICIHGLSSSSLTSDPRRMSHKQRGNKQPLADRMNVIVQRAFFHLKQQRTTISRDGDWIH